MVNLSDGILMDLAIGANGGSSGECLAFDFRER